MNIRYPIYEGVYRILTLRLSATFYYETEKAGYGSGEDHPRLSEPLGGTGRTIEEKGLSGHRQ